MATPTPTKTRTPKPTLTRTPRYTATRTVTRTATRTLTRTATKTYTKTPTQTLTNTPSGTPTLTPTNTPTYTTTNTPTNTSSQTTTNTPTNTFTSTITSTITSTSAPTETPTPTLTSTPTFTNTQSNTPTYTLSSTLTSTPTNTNTSTFTSTLTKTSTPTQTQTRSNTPTKTSTPTQTLSSTPTNTPTLTSTNTQTATSTSTPTLTSTNTQTTTSTNTPTITSTNTSSNTPTNTPTLTLTNTVTSTITSTQTLTPTNTNTRTPTPTNTTTPTVTATNTLTRTVTSTLTLTPTSVDKSIINNHIISSVSSRLVGKDPNTDKFVYSYQDPYYNGLGQFTRNPSCWLNGVSNISCFPPAQMSGANWRQRGGVLITKKHVLFAKHFTPAVLPDGGTPLIFVDANNNVIRRNMVATVLDFTDIAIAVLNSEVPSNIGFAKVLPKNYSFYLDISLTASLYCLATDQEEKVIPKITGGVGGYVVNDGQGGTVNIPNLYVYNLPNSDTYYPFAESTVVGDSGSPVFYIIDNELVVLTTWWSYTTGPFVSTRYDAINSMIEQLSPGEGYSLTPVDLNAVYIKYK